MEAEEIQKIMDYLIKKDLVLSGSKRRYADLLSMKKYYKKLLVLLEIILLTVDHRLLMDILGENK